MKEIDPKALFRLSVLGPLVSRERLVRGERQRLIRDLAQREYAIPGFRRRTLSEKTIEPTFGSRRGKCAQTRGFLRDFNDPVVHPMGERTLWHKAL